MIHLFILVFLFSFGNLPLEFENYFDDIFPLPIPQKILLPCLAVHLGSLHHDLLIHLIFNNFICFLLDLMHQSNHK